MNQHELGSIVVGVDVGGPKKGFHTVALRDGQYRAQRSALIKTQGAGSLFLIAFPKVWGQVEVVLLSGAERLW